MPGRLRLGFILFAAQLAIGAGCSSPPPRHHLLIVVDGLRPDYVTAEVMPLTHTVRTVDGSYAATAMFSTVSLNGRESRYFDGAKVFRPSSENVR